MDREIKFRVWHLKLKKMSSIKSLQGWLETAARNGEIGDFNQHKYLQYTGLKDRYGVEIYDGDVVRIYNYPNTFKNGDPDFDWRVFGVEYNQHTWAFNNSVIYSPLSSYDTHDGTEFDIVVIGNIYENPELLEVQDD